MTKMVRTMNEVQTQIATELCILWQRVPHLRLCQMISDISGPADNYYMSDETFLRKLREFSKVVDQRDRACGRPVVDQFSIEEVARYETD